MSDYVGKFAIYPELAVDSVREHAVIFCETFEMARFLCEETLRRYGTRHQGVLVLNDWPDPLLVTNLNGAPETVWFSTRDPKAAANAAHVVRMIWDEADQIAKRCILDAIDYGNVLTAVADGTFRFKGDKHA